MALSTQSKSLIVTFSNTVILALCVAGIAKNWSQSALELFLNSKLPQVWPFILVYPAFLVIMPLLPRPQKVEIKTAAAPSTTQARFMAVATALIDYGTVGCLCLFWDRVCRLEDGSLCPFTAVCTFLLQGAVMPIKDEIQCRFVWRKFVSPYKLNSWPYSWRSLFDQLSSSVPFALLSLLSLCFDGSVSFEALSAEVVFRVWLEARATIAITDFMMHFVHRWMHEKAYFLHKKHHEGNSDLMSSQNTTFDLLDLLAEFGAGLPVLLATKKLLGLDPTIHLLSHNLILLFGFQHHSGNPYAVYLFNPVLDYLARSTLCHNLHHAIQRDYHLFVPYSHFVSAKNRKKDIDKYNKHMKTAFPRRV